MKALPALIAAGAMSLAVSVNAALVAEWTFDTGSNTAWTSVYAVAPPADIHDAGVYTIGSNPNSAHSAWTSYGPQSGDLMMICNGGTAQSTETAWGNTAAVNLTAGQQYQFSFYSANSYLTAPAPLQVVVSGVGDVGSPFAAAGVGVWQFNAVTFTAPTTGGYTFKLNNSDIEFTGNDFALDTIRVESVPEPVSWTVLALSGLLLMKRRRS